jgi:dimethylargininase
VTLVAITRRPGPELPRGIVTHVERRPVDVALAREQHAAFRAALAELGAEVVDLPSAEGLADAPFVEDTALVLADVAVMTRPVEERRAELASVEAALARFRPIERLEAPSLLEGGDVLAVGDVLYVSLGARTNHAGLKALAHLVLPHGYRVKAVEKRGALHLETACTWLGGERLLVNPDWVDVRRFEGFELVRVHPDEPFAANALRVGDAVVHPAAFPRTAERIERAGLRVLPVDVSEFQKLEAGVTCLALVFRADAVVEERSQPL